MDVVGGMGGGTKENPAGIIMNIDVIQ